MDQVLRYCAVIVENRKYWNWDDIISRHMDHLPGWNLVHWDEAQLHTLAQYNHLLTSQRFWKYFEKYERVLVFQHDSELLKPIDEEFFQYTYLGAPWKWDKQHRPGGNGGLSLRCPKKCLNLIQSKPYHVGLGYEDVYFSHHMENVAPYEVCKRFSVETVYELGTCGYHAIDKYLTPEQCKQIRNQYK